MLTGALRQGCLRARRLSLTSKRCNVYPFFTVPRQVDCRLATAHRGMDLTVRHGIVTSASASRAESQSWIPKEMVISLSENCQVPPATLPFLHQVLEHYAERTPGLRAVVEGVMRPCYGAGSEAAPQLGHDHLAFRTFGVPGLGISSLEGVLLPLGYTRVEEDPGAPLAFPGKKLVAAWFRPTDPEARAVLPRIFVSEIQVARLSGAAQEVIRGATGWAAAGGAPVTVQVLTALLTGTAPWPRPTLGQYELLLRESEYAAWVLTHGYSLNHTALALHRLPGGVGPRLEPGVFVEQLAGAGLELNGEGGLVKVSPDGLLLQCSLVADRRPFTFACGGRRDIAAAYVEFVKRLPLPRFAGLKAEELREEHLREGFEVGNADRIFESTTLAAR